MPRIKRLFSYRFIWMLCALALVISPLSYDLALTAWYNRLPEDAGVWGQWLLQDPLWQNSIALDISVVCLVLNAIMSVLYYLSGMTEVVGVDDETDFYVL